MDLELKNNNTTDNLLNMLYSAQLIANTFAKGLEDNSCLVTSTVQLHQRIKDYTEDVKTLIPSVYTEPSQIVKDVVNSRPGVGVSVDVQNAIKNAKQKCFNCKLELPKLKFDFDLDFSMGELKAHMELYKSLFNLKLKLDPCQAIEVFKFQCIPDILKLISLLLTAYLAINTIKKISGLSLSFFIKGIISALLTKLISSINISLNLGKLNLNCFIEYAKMISDMLPSTDNIVKNLSSEQLVGLIQTLPNDTIEALMNHYLNPSNPQANIPKLDGPYFSNAQLQTLAGAIPKEEIALLFKFAGAPDSVTDLTGSMSEVSRKIDRASKNVTDELKKQQEGLDNIFKKITDTVEESVEAFNEYINQIFSLKAFFECETARSSDNLAEILTQIKSIIDVVNLLSSIVYALAKKEARGICKSNKTIRNNTSEDFSPEAERKQMLKDFAEDYYQKVVEISSKDPENVELLIYKKPVAFGLPKINLLDCSIDNFIKEHTLDAILELATKDVLSEQDEDRKIVDKGPWDSFTIDLKSTNELQPIIKNLTDLLYSSPIEGTTNPGLPPTTDLFSDIIKQQKPKYNVDNSESIKNNESVKCKSIDDVLNMLDTITRS